MAPQSQVTDKNKNTGRAYLVTTSSAYAFAVCKAKETDRHTWCLVLLGENLESVLPHFLLKVLAWPLLQGHTGVANTREKIGDMGGRLTMNPMFVSGLGQNPPSPPGLGHTVAAQMFLSLPATMLNVVLLEFSPVPSFFSFCVSRSCMPRKPAYASSWPAFFSSLWPRRPYLEMSVCIGDEQHRQLLYDQGRS